MSQTSAKPARSKKTLLDPGLLAASAIGQELRVHARNPNPKRHKRAAAKGPLQPSTDQKKDLAHKLPQAEVPNQDIDLTRANAAQIPSDACTKRSSRILLPEV